MKEIRVTSTFTIFESASELPQEVQNAMLQTVEIRNKAYAPYSNFKVGASILLDNGKTILGSNQENAAYPSGLCAERVAVYQAGALYPDAKIKLLTISAYSENEKSPKPIPPCGACRQALLEYEQRQQSPIEIYFMGAHGEVCKSDSVKNLMPLSFDKNFL